MLHLKSTMAGSKRRSPGEGTPRQLPSGNWQWYVREEQKKIYGPTHPDKIKAKTLLHQQLVSERKESLYPSFGTYAKNWLKDQRHSPTTMQTYKYWLQALESDPLSGLEIHRVTQADLRAWWGRQRHKGKDLAHTTKAKRLGWLHQLLAQAGNPVKFKPPKQERNLRRPLSPREREALAEKILNSPAKTRVAVLLTWQVGLRRSEACGIRHEDRDGDGIRINRVVLATVGQLHVRHKAKTAKSHGWVPLPPSLLKEIGNGTGFVIGEGDRPMHPTSLTRMLKDFAKGTILEHVPNMGPHALRRTYGMTLLEMGVDVVTAADLMRHDAQVLLKEYARTREDLKREAVEKAFGSPTPKPHEEVI